MGFTLAEVLITLGIIGIVAAMTLPSVVNKYRAKVLETGLKKSYANIQNAYIMTKAAFGVSNIKTEFATYDVENKVYPRAKEFKEAFYKELKSIETVDGKFSYKNFNNTTQTNPSTCATGCPHITRILPDGSGVGVFINSGNIYLSVDTNGPYKGPNRMGVDAFVFYVDMQDRVMPLLQNGQVITCTPDGEGSDSCTMSYPCSITLTQSANGMGCAWYAINNISPDDETKTYWDNLPK